jgi:tripartite-type tricarboxylate transporter receptor subunit TctC
VLADDALAGSIRATRGLFAPKGTPVAAVSSLKRAVLEAFDDAGLVGRIR